MDCLYRVTMMEEELGRMAPDLGAIEEWRAKDAAYSQRLRDLEAATTAHNQVCAHDGEHAESVQVWQVRRALLRGGTEAARV